MADYLIFHLFCLIAFMIYTVKGCPEPAAMCIIAAAISLVANAIIRRPAGNCDRKW